MSQNSPSASLHCTRCDDVLPVGYRPGLCPVCLMDVAMRQPTQDDTLPVAAPQKPLTPEDLQPHFPQLEILECIGRGGMGVVYKARQKTLGRLVALKLLAPEQKKDAAFAERFAHEARALAALNHPNIVTVHDFGESGGFYYLLMEYVDGVNLRQAMRGSHLSPEQALAIVPPICEALQYAHENGIVHRDIKPENLLMDKSGRVKIADFGIAKMLRQEESTTHDGTPAAGPRSTVIAGTPQYMAPEQGSAGSRADHRVDIYSLGVVLYELLTGELPSSKLAMAPGATTDARLDEIVRRALQQDPEQRYQTVKELQTHLATLSAASVEAQVCSRERYERWFAWLLRAAGVGCVWLGVAAWLKPVLPPKPVHVPLWLNVPLLFWAAAWVLLVHARWLVRISYRPLIMRPRMPVEIGGIVLRLAGLWGMGHATAWLRDHWLYSYHGNLQLGLAMLFLCLGLFVFEHAYAPMAYAIPGWKPLPYAATSTRCRPSGHALVSAAPLALLLLMLPMGVAKVSHMVSSEGGAAWNDNMQRAMVVWGCIATVTTALGWAAVNLIRGSNGRLSCLGLASASALALPLYTCFLVLTFLIYGAVSNLFLTYTTLPNGRVAVDLSPRAAMLIGAAIAAGVACVAVWLWVWKKLRALPRPSAHAAARPLPRTGFAVAGGVAFAALVVVLYSFITMPLPPSPKIPKPPVAHRPSESARPQSRTPISNVPLPPYEPQFARHVERQLNLRLFIHGYSHTLRQGSLKLPPDRHMRPLALPGLRDLEGKHPVKGSLSLIRSEEDVVVQGDVGMSALRFSVPQSTPDAQPKEIVLPLPQAGTHCLCSLRGGLLIEPPAALHERLQTSPENLSAEDMAWLREHQADVVVQMDGDRNMALRFFGGAAVSVPHGFPSGFDWLSLDDRELAKSLAKAYASIPADGGSVLVREQSPTVLAFTTRTHFGLIENLGPSQPGARDARIRIAHLSFNPFR